MRQSTTEPGGRSSAAGRLALALLVMLAVSVFGYRAAEHHWVELLFAHLGGASLVGLLACGAAGVAGRRGYDFGKVFCWAWSIPMVLGVMAVLLIPPVSCGGSFSLAAAVLAVLGCVFLKRRSPVGQP